MGTRFLSIRRTCVAHGSPIEATLEVVRSCPNVFTDISFLQREEVVEVLESDVADRVMFGSDFPAYHAQTDQPWTLAYREKLLEHSDDVQTRMVHALLQFIGGKSVRI